MKQRPKSRKQKLIQNIILINTFLYINILCYLPYTINSIGLFKIVLSPCGMFKIRHTFDIDFLLFIRYTPSVLCVRSTRYVVYISFFTLLTKKNNLIFLNRSNNNEYFYLVLFTFIFN